MLLKISRDARQGRFSYYQNMLDDKNKQQERKAVAAQRSGLGKPKSTAEKERNVKGALDVDSNAPAAMGMTMGALGGARRGLSLHQTAFNQHLFANGATRDDVKSINDTIMELIDKARDKQEDIGDREGRGKVMTELEMINALKRVELKFQDLLEKRQVFKFFKEEELKLHEIEIKRVKNAKKTQLQKDRLVFEKEQYKFNLQKRIDAKKNLVVAKHIRAVERSRKPEHKAKKVVERTLPPEVEEMRKYLGILPDEWDFAASPDKKDEEKTEKTVKGSGK